MKLLPLTLLVSGILAAEGPRLITDFSGPNVRYRCIIGKISQPEFRETASKLLNGRGVKIGALAAYGSLHDQVVAGPRGEDHCGYDRWRSVLDSFDRTENRCPSVQEAVKIGEEILYRSVDHNCQRTTDLLQGHANPLELLISGTRADVLDVSFSRAIGKANEHRIAAQVYVRTREAAVSESLARAITTLLKNKTGVTDLTVELRMDAWFFSECRFPALFPFEDLPKLPTRQEFQATRYVSCSAFDPWPIRCFESASPIRP